MIHLSQPMSWSPSTGLWLNGALQIALQSTLLLALGFVFIFVLRRRSAALLILIYRIMLIGVILCALLSLHTSRYISSPYSVVPFSETQTEQLLRSRVVIVKAWPNEPTRPEPPQQAKLPARPTTASTSTRTPAATVISSEDRSTLANPTLRAVMAKALVSRLETLAYWTWLTVAILFLFWLLACHLHIRRVRRRSRIIDGGDTFQLLRELCRTLKLQPPLLLASTQVSSPFLTGLWRPAILLPANYEIEFDAPSLRAILIHELTHLARRDLWWSALAQVTCVLLWPQPLLWLLGRRMEAVNEEVCDQAVLNAGCAPTDYARSLLDLAERLTLKPVERVAGAGVIPFRSALSRRVRQILDRSRRETLRVSARVRAVVLVGLIGAVALVLGLVAVKATPTQQQHIIVAGPLPDNAPVPAPELPPRRPFQTQSQTIRGVTLRLTKAAWVKPEYFYVGVGDPYARMMAVWYDLTATDPQVRPAAGKVLRDYLTTIKPLDPSGQPVYGTSTGNQGVKAWDGIDPRWATVPIEFEFLDPAAPRGATGEFEESVLFKNVPLPGKLKQPLRVNRTLTTTHGTRVFLEKLAVVPKEEDIWQKEPKILFVVRWEPPQRVPDLEADLSLTTSSVRDDRGNDLNPNTFGYVESGADLLESLPERTTLAVSAPPRGAKFVNVKINVSESAPSLKQEQWFRRFRFNVDMQEVPFQAEVKPVRPVAVAEDHDVTATLETLHHQDNGHYGGWQALGRLWLRARQQDKGLPWTWRVKEATFRDESNHEYKDDFPSGSERLRWKADGTPVRDGETGQEINATCFEARRAPKKLTLETKLEAERRVVHALDFTGLPLPKSGQTMEINQTRQLSTGARLTLRQVGYFTEEQGTSRYGKKLKPLTQFGVLYEFTPAAGSDATASYHGARAIDDKGQPLNRGTGIIASGSLVYLRTPAADAKSLNLRLTIDEVTTGPQKTVVFWNLIPSPAPPNK
ncbi:MAG: M56 family metallopeptidase [Armatimonadota bacterium]|nr:M56 family metallopeptidase [Armatimonadota bacterium]